MSIEVRNFKPCNGSSFVPPFTKLSFDLVALDDFTIDITTFSVTIEMASKIIPSETGSVVYDSTSPEVTLTGSNPYYHVVVVPGIPFDEGQSVTVLVNVDGTDDVSASVTMDEFSTIFTTAYNGVISDFKYAFIDTAMRVPVYNEVLRRDSTTAPRIFDGAFDHWNQDKFLKVRVNQVITAPSDATNPFSYDLDGGRVLFETALAYNDRVDISYTFRFFTDDQIDSFFRMALAQWNNAPPFGGPLSIYSTNQIYQGVLMVGASVFAFRELLMQLAFQEKRIIFDNASWGDGWREVKDLFKSLETMYSDMWKQALENKKARLPSTRIVVDSSFSLPGGRSRMMRFMYKGD